MKNHPNKATVKDGLPTAKEIMDKHALKVFPDTYTGGIADCILAAMQEYSDQQNAGLTETINLCRKSICDEQTINRGLRERISALQTENKDLFLKVKELEFTETVDNDCIESQSNEIDDLKAWKESAMKELNAIDLQSLGAKLGVGLGQSVSENIHAKVDGLLERVKELEAAAQKFIDAVDNEEIIIQENFDNDGWEDCGGRLYKAFKEALK